MNEKFRIAEMVMAIMRHHKGRENAITRDLLAGELALFHIDICDRDLREIYAKLPVCASDDGLFIPVRPEEVEEFRRYLLAKIPPAKANERIRIVITAYPKLGRLAVAANPALAPDDGRQIGLFG
jgi:hypothetical protein